MHQASAIRNAGATAYPTLTLNMQREAGYANIFRDAVYGRCQASVPAVRREGCEMAISVPLVVLAVVSAVWGSITAARMGSELQRRGEKVNWFLMRIQMIRWVARYKILTTAELGRPGPLYRQFTVAMFIALAAATAAFLIQWLR